MLAKIKTPANGEAMLNDDFHWEAKDAGLSRLLNVLLTIPLSRYAPNLAAARAEQAVAVVGGEVLDYQKLDFDPKLIY